MQLRALLLLVVAVLLGAGAVYLLNDYMEQQTQSLQPAENAETTPVVVLAADLVPGARLTEESLAVVDFLPDSVPNGYFSEISHVLGSDVALAPIVLREGRVGEPVLEYMLSSYGARGGLPSIIPEDMRAVTIPVNEVRGVGGFVLPGDYVDILHTTDAGRTDKRLVTRVLLQNTRVLGVDQISSQGATEPTVVNTITLQVSPFDGQRLTLARKLGELSLSLRNEFDASLIEERTATYRELLNAGREYETKVTKRVRRPRIELIRGLQVTNKTVDESKAPAKTGDKPATMTKPTE